MDIYFLNRWVIALKKLGKFFKWQTCYLAIAT